MKITPAPGHIQLKIEEAIAGVLDTSSRPNVVEYAEVIAIGEGVGIKVGQHVFVKAWAIDIVDYQDKKYYFVDLSCNGIKATVR